MVGINLRARSQRLEADKTLTKKMKKLTKMVLVTT